MQVVIVHFYYQSIPILAQKRYIFFEFVDLFWGLFSCWDQTRDSSRFGIGTACCIKINTTQRRPSWAAVWSIFTNTCAWEKTAAVASSRTALSPCLHDQNILFMWDREQLFLTVTPPPLPLQFTHRPPAIRTKGHMSTRSVWARVSKQTLQKQEGNIMRQRRPLKLWHTTSDLTYNSNKLE